VFCREPLPGRTKTRLIPRLGGAGAAELAGAFITDALAKCRALRPGRIVIAASAPAGAQRSAYFRRLARRFGAELVDQGVGSLGARMAHALAPYGQDGAVLLGTDTPTLPSRLLARSVALLRRAPVVLAPSFDGGYYLVGVRGAMPDIFRGIAWGRAGVLDETLARLRRRRVSYALGPGWYDVDRWSDVALLAAHLELMSARQLSARQALPKARRRRGGALASNGSRAANPSVIPCPATARVLRRLGLLPTGR
jgi:rSAM/selenodomain-associated transferase 1